MDLKDFPNTRAIPPKSLPDRKDMPDLDYSKLKPTEKKAGTWNIPTATQLVEFVNAINYLKDEFFNIVGDDMLWDHIDRAEKRAAELIKEDKDQNYMKLDKMEHSGQSNINLVDKSAPSVDNDRIEMKDRKKHRVRFRNEPDGIREKEFEGLSDYHNVHRTDGEDRYNDPGDPRRGY